jgi:hypothetical protein
MGKGKENVPIQSKKTSSKKKESQLGDAFDELTARTVMALDLADISDKTYHIFQQILQLQGDVFQAKEVSLMTDEQYVMLREITKLPIPTIEIIKEERNDRIRKESQIKRILASAENIEDSD